MGQLARLRGDPDVTVVSVGGNDALGHVGILEESAAAARTVLRVPLTLLNDQIVREAARAGGDALDLRSVCTSAADFVRQIEPSAQGARRIAAAIETVARGVPSGAAIALFAARA